MDVRLQMSPRAIGYLAFWHNNIAQPIIAL